jgi:hypothetical protein
MSGGPVIDDDGNLVSLAQSSFNLTGQPNALSLGPGWATIYRLVKGRDPAGPLKP